MAQVFPSQTQQEMQTSSSEFNLKTKVAVFTAKVGQKLRLSTNCICSAIVYFHKLYILFTSEDLELEIISVTALFLAAKVTNEYRLLEHVIKTALIFMDPAGLEVDVQSQFYNNLKKEIISIERLLLQILGFQVDVELPHPDIIEICQKLKVDPAVTKKAYHLATASIMATTMCLQHKPVTVAVVCVNLAAKWAQIQVQNNQQDGESWFSCADPTLSGGTLEKLTNELQNAVVKAAKKTNAPIFNCVLADSVVKGVSLSRNNKRPRCSDENTEIKVKIPRKIVCL